LSWLFNRKIIPINWNSNIPKIIMEFKHILNSSRNCDINTIISRYNKLVKSRIRNI
jgi:hypothetical protein